VEKPFALTRSQAEAMVEAAQAADRFLMEGWLSAFEPGVARLREHLPRLGQLHRVVLSKEQFSSRMEVYRSGGLPPAFNPALGGGSLMDLGIYPVSLAIHLFGEPDRVTATGTLLECGVDARGTVVLSYDCGEHAGLEVVCLHSKTSPGMESSLAGDHDVLSIDDCQWPRRMELRGPAAATATGEDLSVERGAGAPGPPPAQQEPRQPPHEEGQQERHHPRPGSGQRLRQAQGATDTARQRRRHHRRRARGERIPPARPPGAPPPGVRGLQPPRVGHSARHQRGPGGHRPHPSAGTPGAEKIGYSDPSFVVDRTTGTIFLFSVKSYDAGLFQSQLGTAPAAR